MCRVLSKRKGPYSRLDRRNLDHFRQAFGIGVPIHVHIHKVNLSILGILSDSISCHAFLYETITRISCVLEPKYEQISRIYVYTYVYLYYTD